MADEPISNLADGGSVQTTDQLAVNRAGSNFRVLTGALAALDTVSTGRIDNNAVTFNKMQDIISQSFIGRTTASTGAPEQLSAAAAKAVLAYLASEVAYTPTGGVSATDVQGAITELDGDKAPTVHTHTLSQITDSGALAALNTVDSAQIDADAVGASELAQTAVTPGSFTSTDLTVDAQGRITAAASGTGGAPVDSVFGRTGAVVQQAGDYDATSITNTPSGDIAATTVQGALNELDGEKAPTIHTHTLSQITDSGGLAALNEVGSPEIASRAVDFDDELQAIATNTMLGRITAATGNVEELTPAQARTILNVEDGAAADQNASEVPFTPAGNIAATDVQGAIAEVEAEKPQISTEDELAGQMQIAVVATLPGTPDANTIYFVTT